MIYREKNTPYQIKYNTLIPTKGNYMVLRNTLLDFLIHFFTRDDEHFSSGVNKDSNNIRGAKKFRQITTSIFEAKIQTIKIVRVQKSGKSVDDVI